jgi:hypothetical protein
MAQHSSSSTSSNQNTNGSFTGTQTPTNPAWVSNGLGTLGGHVTDLAGQDPYSFVAGANPLQRQAGNLSGSLSGSPWNFDGAADATRGAMSAGAMYAKPASLLDNLQGYMNPYTNDVVNTTLKGFDQNANQTRAQQMLDLGNDSTFGGSGGAILRAQTEGQLGLGRAQTEAQLRDQAFNTGAGLSNQDANRVQQSRLANQTEYETALQRALQGAGQLGNLSTAYDANQRDNAQTMAGIGGTLQGLDQAHAGAPLTVASLLNGAFAGLPLNLLHGQDNNGTTSSITSGTSNTSGNQFGLSGADAANMAAAAAMAFSDRRLKRDIVKLGERPDGLGVYLFRYLWSPLQHIGVMAQEVLKVKPEAVVTTHNGFYAVDYGKL